MPTPPFLCIGDCDQFTQVFYSNCAVLKHLYIMWGTDHYCLLHGLRIVSQSEKKNPDTQHALAASLK